MAFSDEDQPGGELSCTPLSFQGNKNASVFQEVKIKRVQGDSQSRQEGSFAQRQEKD
jgi:hypothetical protein